MLAKWKKEKDAKVDHAVATESGNFSTLFIQVGSKFVYVVILTRKRMKKFLSL